MRGGILAIGIILLILGLFLYLYGQNAVDEVEAYDTEDYQISELLKNINEEVREQYNAGKTFIMWGSIFGIVGFILCIAGIVAPSKVSQKKNSLNDVRGMNWQEYQNAKQNKSHGSIRNAISDFKEKNKTKSKENRRCPECGRVIPDDAKLCPYCGKKFKNHFDEDVLDEKSTKEKNKESKK